MNLGEVRKQLETMVQESMKFTHASVQVYPRVILDLHEDEWRDAPQEIKDFVKENSVVVETWT